MDNEEPVYAVRHGELAQVLGTLNACPRGLADGAAHLVEEILRTRRVERRPESEPAKEPDG